MRVLLLTKETPFCDQAASLARALLGDVRWEKGAVGDPLPATLPGERFSAVLSFVSPWIVPQALLDSADVALNFHPGSCDYPGIGCYNFALYEGATEYGAVCHHMAAKVDTGGVVCESLFHVSPRETVESLKLRTMTAMLQMFHEVVERLARGEPLPTAARTWTRRPFTRKELDELATLDATMSADELRRRVRATTYPGYPGARLVLGGVTLRAEVPDREPLA